MSREQGSLSVYARPRQAGGVVAFVLVALVTLGVLATLAYGVYFQISRGTQDTVLRAQAASLLMQAAHILASEARDIDSDGYLEAPAGVSVLDTNGWEIPASSGAPKSDPWGMPFKYCVWDHGSSNASAGRLAGDQPGSAASISVALISAGSDKSFSTSCSQAASGAGADDLVRTLTIGQTQLAAASLYYGEPVSSVASLPLTDQPTGRIRLVLDTRVVYQWTGAGWVPLTAVAVPVIKSGDFCTGYVTGSLGRDDVNHDLHICKPNGRWTPV